jgi:hypothetical protein
LLLVVSAGCGTYRAPIDETRDDISLAEAQNLFPVAICLPAYVPTGVEAVPHLTYHADFGDPADSELYLRYYLRDRQDLAFEIILVPWPSVRNVGLYESDEARQSAIRDLLGWLVGRPKVKETEPQVTTKAFRHQDDIERWSFEIVEPASLRANLVVWGNTPVYYRVYSRLMAEETLKIAQSIPDCTSKPGATPNQ